jgi:8-oxo-dGTP pyrophosphatase MutT (NUDIX family)
MIKNQNVTALIFNNQNEILCVSRKNNHQMFGLPGGKVEKKDNSLIDALKREVKEETGLDVIGQPILLYAKCENNSMGYTYLCQVDSFDFNTDEPHVVKWGIWDDITKETFFSKWNLAVKDSYYSIKNILK